MSQTNDNTELSAEQVDLLVEARGKDNPTVIEAAVVDQVHEVLGEPLEERIRDPSGMSLEALVAQFTDDDGYASALEALSQTPATGESPETTVEAGVPLDASGNVDIDAMSAGKVREVYDDVKKIDMLESRVPEHAEKLKRELAADLD